MTTADAFEQQLQHVVEVVFPEDSSYAGLVIGTSSEQPEIYTTDDSLFRLLFGVLITNVYCLITKENVHLFTTGENQDSAISGLKESSKLKIAPKSDDFAAQVKEIADGTILCSEESAEDENIKNLSIEPNSTKVEEILIVHKDSVFSRIRNAGRVADGALTKVFKSLMEKTIESGEITSLKSLAKDTRKDLNNPSKINPKLNPADVEAAFYPSIQSGSNIEVGFPTETGSGNLTSDFICALIGIRFKNFCAATGRTYIINGSDEVKKAYKNLIDARDAAIEECKPGNVLGAVYRAFKSKVDAKYAEYIPKSIGGFCGTTVITEHHQITDESEEVIPNNCSIVINVSFKDVKQESGKPFTLLLCDTVQITEEGPRPVTSAKSKYKAISYTLNNEDEEKVIQDLLNDNRTISERTRNKTDPKKKKEEEEDIKNFFDEFKKDRATKIHENQSKDAEEEIEIKSYDTHEQIKYNSCLTIRPDPAKMTVLFPISGVMIPFHIQTIKQVSQSTSSDGKTSTITISFVTPKIGDTESTKYFLKELEYTKSGNQYFEAITKEIKNMQSSFRKFITQQKESRSLYRGEQLRKLIPPPGKNIPRISGSVHIRPTPTGKKVVGNLEAHINGFQFRSNFGKIDVMYRNIELAVFQPGSQDNEMMTLLHFFLKKPIMPIGHQGPATRHITFYKPVGDTSVEVSKTSNAMTDQAEFAEEEHDRKVRKKINKEFKEFVKAIHDPDLKFEDPPDFESPKKQLAFQGAYAKQVATIYPMVNSLISLVEPPPLVVMMDEIEVAIFERERTSSNYIDLQLIYRNWVKDHDRVEINSIPSGYSQNIKDWLDAIGVRYYSMEEAVNWKEIQSSFDKKGKEAFLNELGGWDGLMELFQPEEDVNSEEFDPGWKEDDQEAEEDDDDEEFDAVDDDDEDEEMVPTDDDEDDGKSWRQLDEEAREFDRRSEMKEKERHHHHHHHHHKRH